MQCDSLSAVTVFARCNADVDQSALQSLISRTSKLWNSPVGTRAEDIHKTADDGETMRLRYWTALLVFGGIAFVVSKQWDSQTQDQAKLSDTAPSLLLSGNESTDATFGTDDLTTTPVAASADIPTQADNTVTWTHVVDTGDSLSGLLAEAGLDTGASTEVTVAIGSEYDLRLLKPGHNLKLTMSPDGLPRTASLEIEDGTLIFATFGAAPSVQRLAPDLDSIRRAGVTMIESSIYTALDDAGIPTRFATDLELILAGVFDLRTVLNGGERIRLLWREYRSEGRVVGEPTIDFAQLDLADGRYEILWPNDDSRRSMIFKDSHLVHTFVQPIHGARLSSAFGLRMHPVHGYMRMHSGVDFAAAQGAAVETTQSGKIAFMGERSGYGILVEMKHEGGTSTLYAHLSALNEALQVGQRIAAGTEIGRVGSTGTSTAPHLHYEIHIGGRPVSPLADTLLHGPDNSTPRAAVSNVLVDSMQSELDRLLASRG